MGLCKCAKRKVTNLFCFEHDVNVCEYCLVTDHERCIVQSYVQWLQDSDYNPICILCRNLLKDEETVRLICYDVFHLSCLDKYASQYPSTTAPAGYQCPKCKERIFPPPNLVSPVVDALKQKIQNFGWSRIGLGQSLLPLVDSAANLTDLDTNLQPETDTDLTETNINTNNIDEEFVIVNDNKTIETNPPQKQQQTDLIQQETKQEIAQDVVQLKLNEAQKQTNLNLAQQQHQELNRIYDEQTTISHNRSLASQQSSRNEQFSDDKSSFYDSSLGIVLNMNNYDNDRDTGDYKYQRRPLFEWLNRWLKSRQLLTKVRMTRQKKYLFIVLLIFISLFTLIIIFSRLGTISTEDDPMFDPMNNPNIRIQ